MTKETKQAEKVTTDADKFPVESCRERIARRFGLDSVALSGPCEGKPLVDCVCNQMSQRWDRIKERFSGNQAKVTRLAERLAESFSAKDDTAECEKDLLKLNFDKEAASGIASYLKVYALDVALDDEIGNAIDEIDAEPPAEDIPADLGEPAPTDIPELEEEMIEMEVPGEEEVPPMDEGLGEEGLPMGEDMVEIELPREIVEEIFEALSQAVPGGGMEGAEGEIVELPAEAGEVPGEPAEKQEPGSQVVTSDPGLSCAADPKTCAEGKSELPPELTEKKVEVKEEPKAEDKKECPKFEEFKKEKPEEKAEDKKEEPSKDDEDNNKEEKEASMQLRAGRLRRVGQTLLKIGPEMSINNTDQLLTPKTKDLGKAKEKAVEAPKPLPEGNVHTEGFSAGDNKFQDGSTMGHEPKFDAKEIKPGDVSGGASSLLGKDESFPEGKASVPAGSAPIGGETWQGGDVSTKGTVIASFTPQGLVVQDPAGKRLLVKASFKVIHESLIQAIGGINYDGDLRKYAEQASEIIKKAKTSTKDGITYVDTGALEGKNFTNDAKKAPEGGAKTEKGAPAKKDEGQTKIDTSKLEAEKFTNDAEKKAEAASKAEVKTAGEKQIEDPKPLDKGNIKPEGYMAGGTKVQDGSTMGHEPKFDAKEVKPADVAQGEKSLMGKDEGLPKDKPRVPAGEGRMGNEIWDGGNVSTKGTVIAEEQEQKRIAEARKEVEAEAKVKEARILAASVYAADLLKHEEIDEKEFAATIEKISALPVPAIQSLTLSTRKTRERVEAANKAANPAAQPRMAGLTFPLVIKQASRQDDLKDRLVQEFALTKKLNAAEAMSDEKRK